MILRTYCLGCGSIFRDFLSVGALGDLFTYDARDPEAPLPVCSHCGVIEESEREVSVEISGRRILLVPSSDDGEISVLTGHPSVGYEMMTAENFVDYLSGAVPTGYSLLSVDEYINLVGVSV